MSKQSGLGDNCYVGAYDLSGDIGSLGNISSSVATLDVTAINKSAMERLLGLRDGTMEFSSFFNTDTGASHEALSALPTTDIIASYFRGSTIGNPAASMVAKQIDYGANRADDGSLTFSISASANSYGLEWGKQITPGVRTDGGTETDGASLDAGAASSNGLQAYLHVFSIASGSVDIVIEESSDDFSVDTGAAVTGGTFSSITAPGAFRLATANNLAVERYLRASSSGTFTGLSFALMVVRNKSAVEF